MARVWPDFHTKEAFIAAVDEGWSFVFSPDPGEDDIPDNGEILVGGPLRTNPPRWRAVVTLEGGLIVHSV
jgi:hypothetical protein